MERRKKQMNEQHSNATFVALFVIGRLSPISQLHYIHFARFIHIDLVPRNEYRIALISIVFAILLFALCETLPFYLIVTFR